MLLSTRYRVVIPAHDGYPEECLGKRSMYSEAVHLRDNHNRDAVEAFRAVIVDTFETENDF